MTARTTARPSTRTSTSTARSRRSFGAIRKLPSKRYQARFTTPTGDVVAAPNTFETKQDAEQWLIQRYAAKFEGRSTSVQAQALTLRSYFDTFIQTRRNKRGEPLKGRTKQGYRSLFDSYIAPTFGDWPLGRITLADVKRWHANTATHAPVSQAQSYSLLHTLLDAAIEDEYLTLNPCKIRGAGTPPRSERGTTATEVELATIVGALPPRYRALVLLAYWGGLRFGELTELRRADVTFTDGMFTLQVRRAASLVGKAIVVDTPKSAAGVRNVTLPPRVSAALSEHLLSHVDAHADALLFAGRNGKHLRTSTLAKVWYPARAAAGRPDLRFHDLRHTSCTNAARAGATIAENMARHGHASSRAAIRYQHAVSESDRDLARRLG